MTSAYEATTPRSSTKTCFNDRQLDNPNVEETSSLSSSHVSLATNYSFFEELAVSSVEVSQVQSLNESFDGDVSVLGEKVQRMMDMREEKNVETINGSTNSMNDNLQVKESSGEETFLEDSEHSKKITGSNLISPMDSISEYASTNEQIKNQNEDKKRLKYQRANQDQRNLSVRERCTNDSIHDGVNFRDSTTGDTRVHSENMTKLDPDPTERQDGDSFYDAVRSGNSERVSMLIASGRVQNLDEPDWNVSGDPPLLIAATNRCLPMLR